MDERQRGYQVHGQQSDGHIPGGNECICLPPYKWYTVRAVSYTHLDVYKRQKLGSLSSSGSGILSNLGGLLSSVVSQLGGLGGSLSGLLSGVSVSYTHLDVYKRQIFCGADVQGCEPFIGRPVGGSQCR